MKKLLQAAIIVLLLFSLTTLSYATSPYLKNYSSLDNNAGTISTDKYVQWEYEYWYKTYFSKWLDSNQLTAEEKEMWNSQNQRIRWIFYQASNNTIQRMNEEFSVTQEDIRESAYRNGIVKGKQQATPEAIKEGYQQGYQAAWKQIGIATIIFLCIIVVGYAFAKNREEYIERSKTGNPRKVSFFITSIILLMLYFTNTDLSTGVNDAEARIFIIIGLSLLILFLCFCFRPAPPSQQGTASKVFTWYIAAPFGLIFCYNLIDLFCQFQNRYIEALVIALYLIATAVVLQIGSKEKYVDCLPTIESKQEHTPIKIKARKRKSN